MLADSPLGVGAAGLSFVGYSNWTISSFMCGTVEVAMATKLGSDGLGLIAAGENATHALELIVESQHSSIWSYQHLANEGLGYLITWA